MQCWSFNPQDRPQFQRLVLKLSHILERESGYLDLSTSFCWKNHSEEPLSVSLPVIDEVKEEKHEDSV